MVGKRQRLTFRYHRKITNSPSTGLSHLPKSLLPEQVERLLASCDRQTAIGRRDFAILLLLARLGLRAGEVVALTLEDLDWEAGAFTVHGKGNRREQLPLPEDVGDCPSRKHISSTIMRLTVRNDDVNRRPHEIVRRFRELVTAPVAT